MLKKRFIGPFRGLREDTFRINWVKNKTGFIHLLLLFFLTLCNSWKQKVSKELRWGGGGAQIPFQSGKSNFSFCLFFIPFQKMLNGSTFFKRLITAFMWNVVIFLYLAAEPKEKKRCRTRLKNGRLLLIWGKCRGYAVLVEEPEKHPTDCKSRRTI